MLGISKITTPPVKTIDDIKKELVVFLDKTAVKIGNLNNIQINNLTEDKILLLQKEITGSKNSTFSTLLDKLQNSDWVANACKNSICIQMLCKICICIICIVESTFA